MNPFPNHCFWLGWTLLHAAAMGGTHTVMGGDQCMLPPQPERKLP